MGIMHKERPPDKVVREAGERTGFANATLSGSQRTATPTASRFWALFVYFSWLTTLFEFFENGRPPVSKQPKDKPFYQGLLFF